MTKDKNILINTTDYYFYLCCFVRFMVKIPVIYSASTAPSFACKRRLCENYKKKNPEIEEEQTIVAANRELIARMEKKIQAVLGRVWEDGK